MVPSDLVQQSGSAIFGLLASIEAAGEVVYTRLESMPSTRLLRKVASSEGMPATVTGNAQGNESALAH
jgi:hypothetical protein